MFDHEYRSTWPDEHFLQMFPNVAPVIKQYLEVRRRGKLPSKPQGHEHVYLVAKSFTEFISRLEPGPSD
jgi:hypothetical protein